MLAEMAYYRAHHQEGADAASLAELRRRCAAVLREQLPAAGGAARGGADRGAARLAALHALSRTRRRRSAACACTGCAPPSCRTGTARCAAVLAELGLGGRWTQVVVSAEVGATKPDAAIFEAALRAAAMSEPAKALFVGDSLETDVAGAQAAGLRAVLLDRDGHRSPSRPGRRADLLPHDGRALEAAPR